MTEHQDTSAQTDRDPLEEAREEGSYEGVAGGETTGQSGDPGAEEAGAGEDAAGENAAGGDAAATPED